MDTNTIMLIALAVLVVLSAVGIWLTNRGSGIETPDKSEDTENEEYLEDTADTEDTATAKDTH